MRRKILFYERLGMFDGDVPRHTSPDEGYNEPMPKGLSALSGIVQQGATSASNVECNAKARLPR